MPILISFLTAASSVAEANKQRASSRRALIKPFVDAAVSQYIKEVTSDVNYVLSSVKIPNIPERLSSMAAGTVSVFLDTCFDATESANSAVSGLLDRLYRACSENTQ
jgi:hypothetical protein